MYDFICCPNKKNRNRLGWEKAVRIVKVKEEKGA
jgi:hypothetical protein